MGAGYGDGHVEGVPNKKTELWNELGTWILDAGAIKAKEELLKLNGHEYLRYYSMFCEYFKPKLSRIENREITQVEQLLMLTPDERLERIKILRKQLSDE